MDYRTLKGFIDEAYGNYKKFNVRLHCNLSKGYKEEERERKKVTLTPEVEERQSRSGRAIKKPKKYTG